MSGLQRKLQLSNLSKLPPMFSAAGKQDPAMGGKKGNLRGKKDFTPFSWNEYFERMSDVRIAGDTFRVYESGKTGPVCCFLHGGGFSALSWAVLSKILTGLIACRCMAMDFRGHGDTHTADDENLDIDTMAGDVRDVVKKLYGDDPPPIILIGHSMGGAVATHVASTAVLPSVVGLIVIDVVEGTALEALSAMQSFLKSRPRTFKSVESAIQYCVHSGQIKNLQSAKVSVVGQLKRIGTDETATSVLSHEQNHDDHPATGPTSGETIYEEGDETMVRNSGITTSPGSDVSNENRAFRSPANSTLENQYEWRIELSKTEKFWRGWFEGLSQKFLTCAAAKLLLLAGVDRLDKDLTVGQMQGKFQMQLLPQCGHAVHEDNPDKVAEVIASFLVRYRFVEPTASFHGPVHRAFPV